ncbi:MAG TPA: acetyl-CoA carboxylase biotin carboxyl carrier protein [Solirubrobacteraceae bacterium]|jgi:acetyl-CoA carboxylase biotin carboxyl carrier protein|nr:acetyl-CoA carboxylase biotin carboxyl carrier protein [Solirubrobacteraceae bacterium]
MPLNDDDVREILRIIDESELDELSIETEGFSLHVRKGLGSADARSGSVPEGEGPLPDRAPPPAARPQTPDEDGSKTIPSPMLGTFYRAEAPGAAAFVEVGGQVGPETTVCIIEVMKMMNSVPAGVSGTIAEIVPENGQLVEYGDPLFRVTPDG